MTTYSTTDLPTDQARAQLAARMAAFLDQLRREELRTIDHLRDVAASYAEPHNARRDDVHRELTAARDRLAAINELDQ